MADPPAQPDVRRSGTSGAWGAVDWLLVVLTTVAAVLLVDRYRFVDPDLFMNLFSARDIVAAGGLPGVDTHSFAREQLPWVDYEWLARVIQYGIYRTAGGVGLVLMRLVQALLVVGALVVAARRIGAAMPAVGVAVLMCWPALAHFFLLRARAFSFVMMALLLLLAVFYRRGQRWPGWLMPPLMLVWANLHGAYLLGVVIIGLVVVDRVLADWRAGRGARPAILRGGVVLAASAAVTFLHPAGGGIIGAVARTMTGTAGTSVSEWQPIWEHPFSATASYLLLLPLAVVVGALWAVRHRELLWPLLLAGMALETVLHVRFGALLGLALVVPCARLLSDGLDRIPARGRRWVGPALAAGMAVLCLVFVWVNGHRDLKLRMDPAWTPLAAVRFIQDNDLQGDVLAEFDWSAYLIWAMPESRVFIDGRWDTVYPPEVDEEWTRFARFEEGWPEVLRGSGATAVLLRAGRPADSHILTLPEWGKVYSDPYAVVYVRACEENGAFMARLAAGQVTAPAPITEEDLVLR